MYDDTRRPALENTHWIRTWAVGGINTLIDGPPTLKELVSYRATCHLHVTEGERSCPLLWDVVWNGSEQAWNRAARTDCFCLRAKNLLWGAIHYFKLFSTRTHRPRNPSTKTHCWHLWFGLEGAVLSLWCLHELLESLSSLNSYSNSRRSRPVGFVSDDPTRAHPFLMSARLLLWAVGCLSPGRQKEGEHPAPPSAPPAEGQLGRTGVPRRAANDPYDGLGQPLFGLHYPERDKQSFAVSLDNGPKSKSHRPSFFTRVINSPLCWDASPLPAPPALPSTILSQRFPIVLQTMVSEGSKRALIWGLFANTRLHTEKCISLCCVKQFHILMGGLLMVGARRVWYRRAQTHPQWGLEGIAPAQHNK